MTENKNLDLKVLIEKAKQLWNDFIAGLKKQGKDGTKVEISFWINKQSYLVALGILGGMLIALGVAIFFIRKKQVQLTEKTWDLKELYYYDLNQIQQAEVMSEDKDHFPKTIQELLDFHALSKQEKESVEWELNFKTSVYSEFLRNLLLPSLNIWKDPYTKEIDLSILGKKYLDTNPYQDIALLAQWSSIVRESGKDVGDNEVVNMKIWDIKELPNGFFNIPISISFKSDSKRAFLLLVDKLSLTSNINNLGLLNDFSYYLFDAIRQEKSEEVAQLVEEYGLVKSEEQDEKTFNNAVISRYLYNWIHSDDQAQNLLIDEAIVDMAIKESVVCGKNESEEVCYFRFRDKYRTIPGLAYGIGLESLLNKPLALKQFLANIPPLIAIESFTFDKAKAQGLSLSTTNEYLGNVNFNIYGRGIDPADAEQISKQLTESCFGSGTLDALDASGALVPVQKALEQVGDGAQTNVERMANLLELKDHLQEEAKDFGTLSPYNTIIKKFEFYRMLKNVGLCSK